MKFIIHQSPRLACHETHHCKLFHFFLKTYATHRDYSGGIPYQSTPGYHNQPVGIDGLQKDNETRLSAASAVHGIGAA